MINSWRGIGIGLGLLGLVVLCGCVTTSVPEVSPAMQAASIGTGGGSLENGRVVLTARCISCHGIQPIGKYTQAQWIGVVDEMAPRSKLNETQKRDLLAYLCAARAVAQGGSVD